MWMVRCHRSIEAQLNGWHSLRFGRGSEWALVGRWLGRTPVCRECRSMHRRGLLPLLEQLVHLSLSTLLPPTAVFDGVFVPNLTIGPPVVGGADARHHHHHAWPVCSLTPTSCNCRPTLNLLPNSAHSANSLSGPPLLPRPSLPPHR